MIEFTSLINQPKFEISTELSISIKSISEEPEDSDDFRKWIAHKAVEVGTGKHNETYITEEQEIEVNFSVVMRTLSIATEIKIHDPSEYSEFLTGE